MSVERAKQELREWDAAVSGRISALRAVRDGDGQPLTQRQAHALAGEWYLWFVSQHEEEPGTAEQSDLEAERLEDAYARYAPWNADHLHADDSWMRMPGVRRYVRATLAELGRIPTFLAERNLTLCSEPHERFLDTVEEEYAAAISLLKRRAEGDFGEDRRPLRFPKNAVQVQRGMPGLGFQNVFEAWVKERQPAPSTVNRWRSVFLSLDEYFKGRDIASLTNKKAIRWKGTLVTAQRSAVVANDIWLTAARTVFAWALSNKLVSTNPFKGCPSRCPLRCSSCENASSPKRNGGSSSMHRLHPRLSACSSTTLWHGGGPLAVRLHRLASRGDHAVRGQDVQNQDGLWVLRITPEAGAVKGRRARVVPIHDHLVEQGFVAFAEAQGDGPLFYDPNGRRNDVSDPFKPIRAPWVKAREKLAEWVRSLGVTDPNISPVHAWRHTFKRRASRAGIERHVRDAICGHKLRDVGDKYEAPTVEDMAVALRKLPRYELT